MPKERGVTPASPQGVEIVAHHLFTFRPKNPRGAIPPELDTIIIVIDTDKISLPTPHNIAVNAVSAACAGLNCKSQELVLVEKMVWPRVKQEFLVDGCLSLPRGVGVV